MKQSQALRGAEFRVDVDDALLLARLGEKNAAAFQRQIVAFEKKGGSGSTRRWRQLVAALAALAPQRAKIAAANAVQFYIPDGKYFQQVFALQALPDGGFALFAPDVLERAVTARILAKRRAGDPANIWRLTDGAETLSIESLDGSSPNQEVFAQDLTGWNRKAIRITLPPHATDGQIAAALQLCTLAARQWT